MEKDKFDIELENRIQLIEEELKTKEGHFSKKDWLIWAVVVVISFGFILGGAFIA